MLPASRSRAIFRWFAVACLLGPLVGCTSAISSAYLRNMPWDGPEHAAQAEPDGSEQADGDDETTTDEAVVGDGLDDGAAETTPGAAADELPPGPGREAAIEEAVARISRLGALSAAAQDALVETLRHTQQQDWPVVIEEFAAALAANAGSAATAGAEPADPAAPPTPPEPPAPPASAPVPEVAAVPTPAPAIEPETPAAPEAAPPDPAPTTAAEPAAAPVPEPPEAQPPVPERSVATEPAALEIDNACFATRVRGWGAVDRFPTDTFCGGQELIVYFELDNLSCGTSAAGHTTCIDTALALVDAEGRTLHRWTFEPVTETSPARRRDYFARYVLALPDGLATGPCRLELAVTDALAGGSATTTLPLEITAD